MCKLTSLSRQCHKYTPIEFVRESSLLPLFVPLVSLCALLSHSASDPVPPLCPQGRRRPLTLCHRSVRRGGGAL